MNTIGNSQKVIRVTTKAAKLNIKSHRPKLKIRHTRPQMQVNRKASKFKINRSYVNVKRTSNPVIQISSRFLKQSSYKADDYYISSSNKSDTFDNFVADLNFEQAVRREIKEMKVVEEELQPTQLEKISIEWDQGYLDIEWTDGVMEFEWDIDSTPEISVEPGEIKIYVKERTNGGVKVKAYTLTGVKVDKKV